MIDTKYKFIIGNYGRAFAFASNKLGLNGNRCLMPDTAPLHRSKAIESMGVTVERLPSANLRAGVKKHEEDGMVCNYYSSACVRIFKPWVTKLFLPGGRDDKLQIKARKNAIYAPFYLSTTTQISYIHWIYMQTL